MKTLPTLFKNRLFLLWPAALLLAGLLFSPAQAQSPDLLGQNLTAAATEFSVPVDLLVALGWTRSHLRNQVSEAGEYGVMQLPTQSPTNQAAQAATLLGITEDELKTDTRQNIRGAAALLRQAADRLFSGQTDLSAANWFEVVAAVSFPDNASLGREHARQVFTFLADGLTAQVEGETLTVSPWPEAQPLIERPEVSIASDDFAPAHWVASSSSNYTDSQRTDADIDMIVIHTTEGSYSGAINWLTQAGRGASAHYIVRSSDGDITQMVRDEDVAWHAGHWSTNLRSIGIEHEAFVSDSSWYTTAMYQSSARLVRYLAAKYNIPLDRQHIIGHVEAPGCTSGSGGGVSCHTDPGKYWDWTYFMQLVLSGSATSTPTPVPTSVSTPTSTPPPTTAATATALATATPTPAASTGSGNLVGLVVNSATNARLPGAVISAGGQTTQANQNGVYYLTGLPAGSILITATYPGFVSATITGQVEAGTTRWASFQLTPQTGSPTPAATVTPVLATATPAPTSTFTPTPVPATATPTATTPTGTLVGIIQDAVTGQRLTGVTVSALGKTYLTDSRGYYWLDLPAGTQVITAQKTGYKTAQSQKVVVAGATQWNSLKLQPQ